MDLYRYFHPHHNPRLRNKPLRLQELGELEQAALELKKAVKRAEIRAGDAPLGAIKKDHFSQLLVALEYIVESLETLSEAHEGDSEEIMGDLLSERESAPGWENWCRLLKQRLEIGQQFASSSGDRKAAGE